jgi:hypothetical protein
LEHGEPLFGLGEGCGEWRATPAVADDEADGTADETVAEATADEATTGSRVVMRNLSAVTPDAEGRMWGFSYFVTRDHDPVRMRLWSRGWHPAPGVVIPAPNNEGYAVIGSAGYCVYDVDVRASADDEAVLVGDETWFLSRAACARSRSKISAMHGCTKKASDHR